MMHALPPNPNKDVVFDEGRLQDIYLAGGCFWGTEAFMERVPGVAWTQCGYANGTVPNPTYQQVCHEHTGHAETVHVRFDPDRVSLGDLLKAFFLTINPTTKNRQGNDMGSQYRSGVYYTDEAHLPVIEEAVKREQEKYERPIVTEVLPLICYFPAEEYHQKYLEKNPGGYCHVDLGKLTQVDQ